METSAMALVKFLAFVISLLSFARAEPGADSEAVCAALYQQYPSLLAYDPLGPDGTLTLANDTLWSTTLEEYWNVHSDSNRPKCMFFPSDADEVSFSVQQLNKYIDAPFALKSGGHNANLGFSSTSGGVLLSFRPNLQSTTISDGQQTANVGPGARWGEVYTALNPYGKAVVGGRLGHIGVGGFILGGGLSYLSSQYVSKEVFQKRDRPHTILGSCLRQRCQL